MLDQELDQQKISQLLASNPKMMFQRASHAYVIEIGQKEEPIESVEEKIQGIHQKKEKKLLSENLKNSEQNLLIVSQSHNHITQQCSKAEADISEIKSLNTEQTFNEQTDTLSKLKSELESLSANRMDLTSQLSSASEENKQLAQTIAFSNFLEEECLRLKNLVDSLESQTFLLDIENKHSKELLEITEMNLETITQKAALVTTRIETENQRLKEAEDARNTDPNQQLKKEIQLVMESNEAMQKKLDATNSQIDSKRTQERSSKKNLRSVKHQLDSINEEIAEKNDHIIDLRSKIDVIKRKKL